MGIVWIEQDTDGNFYSVYTSASNPLYPGSPAKEYIRLSGQVIAVENLQ